MDDPFGEAAEPQLQPPTAAEPLPTFGENDDVPPPLDAMQPPTDLTDSEPFAIPVEATPAAEPAAEFVLPEPEPEPYAPPPTLPPMEQVMGPLAEWRLEQQEKVAKKNSIAEAARAEKLAAASAELDAFYKERADKIAIRATQNREEEKVFVSDRDQAALADNWESVCKLVDLKDKESAKVDTSRMKSLLMQLKHQ